MNTIAELVRSLSNLPQIGGRDYMERLVGVESISQALQSADVNPNDLVDAVGSLDEESRRGIDLRTAAASAAAAMVPTTGSRMSDLALEFTSLVAEPNWAIKFAKANGGNPNTMSFPSSSPLRSLPSYTAAILEQVRDRVIERGARRDTIERAIEALHQIAR